MLLITLFITKLLAQINIYKKQINLFNNDTHARTHTHERTHTHTHTRTHAYTHVCQILDVTKIQKFIYKKY